MDQFRLSARGGGSEIIQDPIGRIAHEIHGIVVDVMRALVDILDVLKDIHRRTDVRDVIDRNQLWSEHLWEGYWSITETLEEVPRECCHVCLLLLHDAMV